MMVELIGAAISAMQRKHNKAFSLIEVLVSLFLFSFVMVAGMGLYFNAQEIQSKASHKKMAVELVNSKIEELKGTDYSLI